MKTKVSCISLPVQDIHRSLQFYKDGLGLKIDEDSISDDHVAIEFSNGMYLVLLQRKEFDIFAQRVGNTTSPKGNSECILSYFAGSREEVTSILNKAKKAGVTPIEAKDQPWGYSGYFNDPDGHIWEIMFNPKMYAEQ